MAEKEQESVPVVSTVAGLRRAVNAIIEPMTRDGTLAAFFRQGADEMAVALKAFPESISVDEPGTILNPTQGEIAAERKTKLPSPSEIAASRQPYRPDSGQDHDHGHGRGR
jgi:hypothetical protein